MGRGNFDSVLRSPLVLTTNNAYYVCMTGLNLLPISSSISLCRVTILIAVGSFMEGLLPLKHRRR